MSTEPVRTLIVDDNAEIRQLLRFALGFSEDFDVVGEATDGTGAVLAYVRTPPYVLRTVDLTPGPGRRPAHPNT